MAGQYTRFPNSSTGLNLDQIIFLLTQISASVELIDENVGTIINDPGPTTNVSSGTPSLHTLNVVAGSKFYMWGVFSCSGVPFKITIDVDGSIKANRMNLGNTNGDWLPAKPEVITGPAIITITRENRNQLGGPSGPIYTSINGVLVII